MYQGEIKTLERSEGQHNRTRPLLLFDRSPFRKDEIMADLNTTQYELALAQERIKTITGAIRVYMTDPSPWNKKRLEELLQDAQPVQEVVQPDLFSGPLFEEIVNG